MDSSETFFGLIISSKIKKIMKKKFWLSRDQNIVIYVFSVFNEYKTNGKSVVFESTPLINEINTLFMKNRNFRNYHFSRKKN